MRRVVRWNRRTPNRVSSRAMALPTAEREMPNASAASVKLPERAVVTNVTRPFKDSSGSISYTPIRDK